MMKKDNGYISVQILLMIFAVTMLIGGVIIILHFSIFYENRFIKDENLKKEMLTAAEEIVNSLISDSTPEEDSRKDEVWEKINNQEKKDMIIDLEDLSSKINPNLIRKNLIDDSDIKNNFLNGENSDNFQQFREDNLFFTNPESFKGYFDENYMEKHFSCYSPANINITDEFVLKRIYEARTGSKDDAEKFHQKIQSKLKNKEIINLEELEKMTGDDFNKIYPFVFTQPQMNVNFISEYILTQIIGYDNFYINNPEQKVQTIVSKRENEIITEQMLKSIIGAEENNRIYQYLGTHTWMWKLKIKKEKIILEYILMRIPDIDDKVSAARLLEIRWYSE